jgi:elongation factor 1-gamma
VQQWLWFSFQHFEPTFNTLCLWRWGDGKYASYNQKEEERAEGELRRWLGYLEGEVKKLEEGKWLAGTAGVSLADLAVCGQLYIGFLLYIDEEMRKEYPGVVGFYKKVLEAAPEVKDLHDLEGKWVQVRKQPPAAD